MNKETVLGVLLFMLSLSLAVVPIVMAFSAHGWDPKATLLGDSNPIETQFGDLQNLNLENMFGNPDFGNLSNLGLTDLLSLLQGGPINITIPVTSPLNFPITVKNISGNLVCREHGITLGYFQLANEVQFPAYGSNVLTIAGSANTAEALADVATHGGWPNNTGFENVTLKLEIYGIVIEGTIESI